MYFSRHKSANASRSGSLANRRVFFTSRNLEAGKVPYRESLLLLTPYFKTQFFCVNTVSFSADGVVSVVHAELAMKAIDAGKCKAQAKYFCDEVDFATKHNHKVCSCRDAR